MSTKSTRTRRVFLLSTNHRLRPQVPDNSRISCRTLPSQSRYTGNYFQLGCCAGQELGRGYEEEPKVSYTHNLALLTRGLNSYCSRMLTKGTSARVHVQLRPPTSGATRKMSIPLETFAANKSMGRILFRRGGETIGELSALFN